MAMLDILKDRLPDGFTIMEVKEKSSKYLVKFAYNSEQMTRHGELVKACTLGKENLYRSLSAFCGFPKRSLPG